MRLVRERGTRHKWKWYGIGRYRCAVAWGDDVGEDVRRRQWTG
jgi:hypothetical protein